MTQMTEMTKLSDALARGNNTMTAMTSQVGKKTKVTRTSVTMKAESDGDDEMVTMIVVKRRTHILLPYLRLPQRLLSDFDCA